MKLNLACGNDYKEGYTNLDLINSKADIKADIEEGIPLENNSCEEILAYRILEHINPHKMDFVLNEIERIAKPNCILKIIVPFDNILGRADLDHKRAFNWNTFSCLEQPIEKSTPKIKLRLRMISRIPPKFIRVFFYLFPILYPKELNFEFIIIK
jgi:predicted SAM-dependent methyltransferase